MKKALINKQQCKSCLICANGTLTADEGTVLCPFKGVMDLYDSCRKFIYDPLKREPRTAPALPSYNANEFEL